MARYFKRIITGKFTGAGNKNENELEWVKEILTELELIVDSTEQSRERSSEYKKPEKSYSGKKRSHTFKNQIITTPKGHEIVDAIVGERGPESDINLLRKQQEKFDDKQKFQGDKAFQGAERTTTPLMHYPVPLVIGPIRLKYRHYIDVFVAKNVQHRHA